MDGIDAWVVEERIEGRDCLDAGEAAFNELEPVSIRVASDNLANMRMVEIDRHKLCPESQPNYGHFQTFIISHDSPL